MQPFFRLAMLFFLFLHFLLTNSFLLCEHFIVHNQPFWDSLFNEIASGCDLDRLARDYNGNLNEVILFVDPDVYKLLYPVQNEINNEAVCAELVGDNYEQSPNDFTVCVSYPPENVLEMSNQQIKEFLKETTVVRMGPKTQGAISGEIAPFTRFRVEPHNDLLNLELNREINDIKG
jgi:hypothetical protein